MIDALLAVRVKRRNGTSQNWREESCGIYGWGEVCVCSVFVPVYHVFSWLERDEAPLKSGSDI